eukprot:Lithocolla_globosa_v1_NODE_5206_length_1284_cov_2.837266.p2 type:complete len:118 gc:universal NODE_5206_length_1284_cov_2.837266:712-359(-)
MPRSASPRTRAMNGVIGSLSRDTSRCMRRSRIIKFVAHVSSSSRSVVAPTSRASSVLAAWEVEPEASAVVKVEVCLPCGKSPMKIDKSTLVTALPSSALILTVLGSTTTPSLPSPGM